ncbi:MAG TPA: ABC transporter ATP-binding protein [Bacteroidales bacterium]|nr:ABC transporter ATP-binding protein [Bacteroidota bacterium]HJN06119.1 ABC transporter ATP-binding protein [Bacteroidales bacterium]
MLQISNLSIEFNSGSSENRAVDSVNLKLDKGMALGLVGESGSGKSVTALAIMQLLPPQANILTGEINFDNVNLIELNKESIRKLRGNNISMIFQEPATALNPVIRCGKQVAESIMQHQRENKKTAYQQVISLFNRVNLPRPEDIYKSYPHQLSGGQKQRIMIAMAIANKPDLLIADEPTTALDVTIQKEIITLLKSLREEYGMGLLFISHDLGVISEIVDEVAVMYKGRIVESGKIKQVFEHPKHPYTIGLLACRPPIDKRIDRLPEIDDYLNSEVDNTKTPPNTQSRINLHKQIYSKLPILKVQNLEKKYSLSKNLFGKTTSYLSAVDDISFDVFPGETLGLVGESGCGKTTLGRSILRLIEPDNGSIFFNNKDIISLNTRSLKKQRKNINIVFQDPYSSLNPRISIGNAIIEPMKVHKLYGNNKQRKEKVIGLLQKVGLKKEHFNRYPHEFSGGQRQRIVIARTLALNPKFIICDEAVSALDVSIQAKVLNLLNDLKKEFGFTYIFISHDLSVVRFMSDRIMVMKDGNIIEIGDADTIYNSPKSEYTKKLIASEPAMLN